MTTKFGWCLDGRHAQCRRGMDYQLGGERRTLTCGCACHDDDQAGEAHD